MFYCCGISEIGNTRKNNEDAFLIKNIILTHSQLECAITPPFIGAVADGVAGENSGEIASRLCLTFLDGENYCKNTDLKKHIMSIHKNLRYLGTIKPDSLNMQTTLCALAVDEDENMKAVNVGDSRMYRFSEGEIFQITKDQSYVQFLADCGEISRIEKENHKYKNVIFPAIGSISSDPVIDTYNIPKLKEDEFIFMCTDGLTDFVSKDEIEKILSEKYSFQKKVKKLVQTAIMKGSTDNITVLTVSWLNE